jgi:hypothetical protein
MRGFVAVLAIPLLLTLTLAARGQAPKAAPPKAVQQNSSFVDRVLSFLGISDSPGTLKGPGDEVSSGELWVVDLESQTRRAIAPGRHYRSPVFAPDGKEILALSGGDVVRLSLESQQTMKLFPVVDVSKLVGFSSADPDSLLILRSGGAGRHSRVGLLTISTAKLTALSYDPASESDLQMVENLEGWTRSYGGKQLYVRRQTKQTLSGTVEWSDVFLQVDSKEPRDVSLCDGANCGQPSLSADGRLLVYVKAPLK